VSERIEARASFSFIRYANCWEDADVLCEVLQPRPGMRILSVASAGDNTLALLGEGAEVVAADLSPAQLACLELRCAAFRQLSHPELLAFLGVTPAADRLAVLARLEDDLSLWARQFWRARPRAVATGIIHAGKFEAFFRLIRTYVLPLVHSRRTLEGLLQPRDAAGRAGFYERTWNTWRWRLLFRVVLSRWVLGHLARDPEFFRHVEGTVAPRIVARIRHALTALPTHDNPYLAYVVTGGFGDQLPRYLRPEHFAPIRSGLDRLTLAHGSVEWAGRAHRGRGFDAFNLSDIFEYVDPAACREIYQALLDVARPRARLAYWNTLVPREAPPELADRVRSLRELAAACFARDRAFFYCAFVVEEVR
jgi:S-adenosylmethionine-diacylglycerol 3-amino-3-carboxypropyl transferase